MGLGWGIASSVFSRWSLVIGHWSLAVGLHLFGHPSQTPAFIPDKYDTTSLIGVLVMAGSYKDHRAEAIHGIGSEIYRFTENFPKEERYGLTSQLRRAAVSVSSNIAEGKGQCTDKELLLFLNHARGSLL